MQQDRLREVERALVQSYDAGDMEAVELLAAEVERLRGVVGEEAEAAFVSEGMDRYRAENDFATFPPIPGQLEERERQLRAEYQRRNPSLETQQADAQRRARAQGDRSSTLVGGALYGASEAFNISDELAEAGARVDNFINRIQGSPRRPLNPELVAQAQEDELAQRRSEEPMSQMGREFLGQLPLAPAAVGRGLFGAMATGGLLGGAAGAGRGDDLQERGMNAGVGAVVGASTAGAFDRAGAGAGYVARRAPQVLRELGRGLRNRFGGDGGQRMTRAQRRAVQRLRQAFKDDGIDAASAESAMQDFVERGFDDVALLDVGGDSVRREVRRAAGTAGPGSAVMEDFFEARRDSQPSRVVERINRFFSDNDDFRATRAQAIQRREDSSAPLYAAFREQPGMPREELAEFMDDPLFVRIARRAVVSARRRDGAEAVPKNALDGDTISPDVLNRIKIALDERIQSARSRGDAVDAGDLTAFRSRFVSVVDEAYPQYRVARDAYAGNSALVDAMNIGRESLRMDTEELAEISAGMSQSERDFLRVGMVRAVRERAGNVADGRDVAAAINRNPNMRDRMRQAFDNDEEFNRFIEALTVESNRVQVARGAAASSGSQTAPRASDQIEAAAGDIVTDLASGNFTGPGMRVVRGVGDVIAGGNRRIRDSEIVNIATRPMDTQTAETILAQIEREYGAETAQQFRRLLQGASGPASVVAGSAAAEGRE
jgi:hypothetical protein